MHVTYMTPDFAVAPQICTQDLQWLAHEGFTDIVCNRPDAEHPEDAQSPELKVIAKGLGMRFHYLPIAPGEPFDVTAREIGRLTSRPGAKVLAYCRSGARSTAAWTLAQTQMSGAAIAAR